MAAPWEKPKSTAPWENAKSNPAAYGVSFTPPPVGDADVEQVQHPNISAAERALVKNLGADPQDAMAMLQKSHPDMEFKLQNNGEIAGRVRDVEKTYKALDPQSERKLSNLYTGASLSDLPGDVADLAFDIPATLAKGAAAAVAGGSLGPWMAPAAVGAVGAGTEALRQGLGKYFGVNKEVDLGDAATAGVLDAIGAKIFGFGTTSKQIAAAATPKNIRKTLGIMAPDSEAANFAEKFVEKKLYDTAGLTKYLPKFGQFTTGLPSETFEAAGKEAPVVAKQTLMLGDSPVTNLQAVKKIQTTGAKKVFDSLGQSFKKGWMDYKGGLSKRYDSAIDSFEEPLDVSATAVNPLLEAVNKIRARNTDKSGVTKISEDNKETIGQLEGLVKKFFTSEDGGAVTSLSARSARDLEENLGDFLKTQGEKFSYTAKKALKDSVRNLSDQNDAVIAKLDPSLVGEYRRAMAAEEILRPVFEKGGQSTFRKLSSATGEAGRIIREAFQDVDRVAGTELVPSLNFVRTMKAFENPSFEPVSGQGSTSTSRTLSIANLMGGLASKLGFDEQLAQALSGKIISPAAARLGLTTQQALTKNPMSRAIGSGLDAAQNAPWIGVPLSGSLRQAPKEMIKEEYRIGGKK
jgi:hypothetical protein